MDDGDVDARYDVVDKDFDHLSVDGTEPWKRSHATENMLLWRFPL